MVSVIFGDRNQSNLTHLVKIFNNMKKVINLKQKANNDPENSEVYEKEMWVLYDQITSEKS